jgi:hypothetical protein
VLQILPADNQTIQNTVNGKESAPKLQGTNGVELQCVHLPLPLLNSKNFLGQNKTDHLELNWLHYL